MDTHLRAEFVGVELLVLLQPRAHLVWIRTLEVESVVRVVSLLTSPPGPIKEQKVSWLYCCLIPDVRTCLEGRVHLGRGLCLPPCAWGPAA